MMPCLMQQSMIPMPKWKIPCRSQENCSIFAGLIIWSVESISRLIMFLHIFLVTLEISTTFLQIDIPLKMQDGEISNQMDIEMCDIMLTQPLVSQKLLVLCLIKLDITNKLIRVVNKRMRVASHCSLALSVLLARHNH